MCYSFDSWDSPYLAHYGVLGMKWHVHRGKALEAYDKAMKKKSKLDTKAAKNKFLAETANKKMQKALKSLGKAVNKRGNSEKESDEYFKNNANVARKHEKADKATKNYENAKFKASKSEAKAAKWTHQVLKTFGTIDYSEIERKYGKSA